LELIDSGIIIDNPNKGRADNISFESLYGQNIIGMYYEQVAKNAAMIQQSNRGCLQLSGGMF